MVEEDENEQDKMQLKYSEDEKNENDSILKTLNYLSKKDFKNFKQTLLNDFIPKFMIDFFKISKIDRLILTESTDQNTLTMQNIKNIYAVIDFLKTKEKTFSILMFDFYTPFERESSAKNLFKNFLNFFFITKPRYEMINRYTIFTLTTQISLNTDRYNMLIQLMKFIGIPPDQMSDEFILIKKRILKDFPTIPLVFDNKQYQSYINDSVYPDSFFYQLQFIFNEWDSNAASYPVIEKILTARYKLTHIKLLRFDVLASSIKSKRFKFDDQEDESNFDDQEKEEEEEKKEENTNKSTESPKKFSERHDNEINNLQKEMIESQDENINARLDQESSEFWNPPLDILSLKEGIIIDKKNNSSKIDFNMIKKTPNKNMPEQEQPDTKKARRLSKSSSQNQLQLQKEEEMKKIGIKMLSTHQSIETKLYKLFQFNESERRWVFNQNIFDEFAATKRINVENSKTPLIFYCDSDEKEIKNINSNFILGTYPKFTKEEEEQFFVYPLCDKALSMLNLIPDFNNPGKSSIKPIFLILHIPKNKEKHPLLSVIINQIYCFLASICNLMIIIMKDKYIENQINFVKDVFKRLYDYNIFQKDDNDDKKSFITNTLMKLDIVSKQKKKKGPNLLFLINNKKVEYNNVSVITFKNHSIFSPMMTGISAKAEFLLIHDDKIETYKEFLDSFSSSIMTDNNYSTFSKVNKDFASIENFEMSNLYLSMIDMTDWSTALAQTIQKRYGILASKTKSKSEVSVLSFLYNELSSFSPKVDTNFVKKYQNAILSMRKEVSQANKGSIKEELKKSSELDIEYISGRIKEKDFWTLEQLDKIRCIHELFLRKEYFDIVKTSTSDFNFNIIFEDNHEVLTQQIKEDRDTLSKIFENPMNILKRRDTIVQNDVQTASKKGTNYILKENETTRELTITIDVNQNLTTVIDQDF